MLCSMQPLRCRNAYTESRIQDVNILRVTVSSVLGLKLAGSDGLPVLCMRMVHAFSKLYGIVQYSKIEDKDSVGGNNGDLIE